LKYHDNATETIDLNTVKWELTRKNCEAYLPMDSAPPIYPLQEVHKAATVTKYAWSSDHKVKDHQAGLTASYQSIMPGIGS
uniref:Uncharacterized protein n=1 Tax=Amphimedon queenslandica TaxID=400682 RepID=A0A1X7UFV2_AMPQE